MMVVSHGCKWAAHPSNSVVTDVFFTLNEGMHRAETICVCRVSKIGHGFLSECVTTYLLMIKPKGSWMNTPAGKLLKTMVAKA